MKKHIDYYKHNIDYLCDLEKITYEELSKKLGLEDYTSLEGLIKICNYFDIAADEILFNNLKHIIK